MQSSKPGVGKRPRRGSTKRHRRHLEPGRWRAQCVGSEILDRNFGTYDIPRFSWVPKIETILVKNDEVSPQGGGQPAITPTRTAIANAVLDAAGARLFRLPLTPERLRQALAAKNATATSARAGEQQSLEPIARGA